MRPAPALILALVAGQLSSCGGGRPLADRVEIAGQAFDIPIACTGTGAFFVSRKRVETDQVLLRALLPDAGCSDRRGLATRVIVPTERSPDAVVLVAAFRPAGGAAAAQDAAFDLLTTSAQLADGGGRRELASSGPDRRFRFEALDGYFLAWHDAWRSRQDPTSFIICGRRWRRGGVVQVGRCEHRFLYRGLSFQVTYGSAGPRAGARSRHGSRRASTSSRPPRPRTSRGSTVAFRDAAGGVDCAPAGFPL